MNENEEWRPGDRYLSVDGLRLRYWEAGEGARNVVLIHGVGSYVERWLPIIRRLAGRLHVYAVDLPGRGLSDKPGGFSYHVANIARVIKDFSDELGLETANYVGSSLGGAVAAHLARQFPERVERLVLSSSAGWGRQVTNALRIVGFPGLGELIGRRQSREASRRLLLSIVEDPEVITDAMVDLHYRMSSLPGAWQAFLRLLRANGNLLGQGRSVIRPLKRELTAFTKPVLILWGDRDRIIPPSHLEVAAAVLPHAETKIIEGCGHFLMLERPDEYAEALLRFLDRPLSDTRS